MDKKEEIYQHVYNHTLQQLRLHKFHQAGCDALNISLDLQMDRSNVSRLLNQLHQENRLIKTQSRPTIFFARIPIENMSDDTYIPSILPKGKEIMDYMNSSLPIKQASITNNCFREYIADRNTSSMYEPIRQAKAALLYPPQGLNILLYGDPCIGKLKFAKELFKFGIQNSRFTDSSRFYSFDCLSVIDSEPEDVLQHFFGYYDGERLHKGLFELAKHGVLAINHMDRLPFSIMTSLANAIMNQQYTPIHLSHKEYQIRCLTIGISNSENLIENPDIRRCFPMQIHLPSLHEKSIQEMLVLTMQYFQEEAKRIDKTIRISKGALSCFVMSNYSGNLPHLHAEIKQCCAHAYCHYLTQESLFVSIGYDDISTPVLTDIFDVNKRINELDNVLNLFESEYLFFSALQQNQELELLYELNDSSTKDNVYLNKIEDKLITLCIQDMDAAVNIHLNTIRSVMVKQVYDIVYPILQDTPVCKNENLLYGLLLHISNAINKQKSGIQDLSFKAGEFRIAKEDDYHHAKKIHKLIQQVQDIKLPQEEIDYIATYLYLSSQWIDNRYIQLLVISANGDSAKDYADYLNGLGFKTHISWLKINSERSEETNCTTIIETMKVIDRGKGVIIATDSMLVSGYEPYITAHSNVEFTIIQNISAKILVSIAERMESLGVTIRSIRYLGSDKTDEQITVIENESHAQELLNNISEKVLSESLVFLNPAKVCQSLFNVLLNIIHDLQIKYSDDLLIKFIFHSGFTIERCIRKEPLTYTRARALINQNEEVYYVIEKNFEIISEIFNVSIPNAEMAMIMEIFLPYLEV